MQVEAELAIRLGAALGTAKAADGVQKRLVVLSPGDVVALPAPAHWCQAGELKGSELE